MGYVLVAPTALYASYCILPGNLDCLTPGEMIGAFPVPELLLVGPHRIGFPFISCLFTPSMLLNCRCLVVTVGPR